MSSAGTSWLRPSSEPGELNWITPFGAQVGSAPQDHATGPPRTAQRSHRAGPRSLIGPEVFPIHPWNNRYVPNGNRAPRSAANDVQVVDVPTGRARCGHLGRGVRLRAPLDGAAQARPVGLGYRLASQDVGDGCVQRSPVTGLPLPGVVHPGVSASPGCLRCDGTLSRCPAPSRRPSRGARRRPFRRRSGSRGSRVGVARAAGDRPRRPARARSRG